MKLLIGVTDLTFNLSLRKQLKYVTYVFTSLGKSWELRLSKEAWIPEEQKVLYGVDYRHQQFVVTSRHK